MNFANRKHLYIFCFIFIESLLFSPNISSDTIRFKSGKSIAGTIKERTEKFVLLDVGLDFPVTYYFDEILEIVSDQTDQSALSQLSVDKQADAVEQEGLSFIEQGQMVEGLTALRKAVELSGNASQFFNLGSVLFGNAVAVFKQGDKQQAFKIFKEAEDNLKKSIDLFEQQSDKMYLSQAYFLLGEMQAQGFENKKQAQEYYEKSISFYVNPAAERGLKLLDQ